MKKIPERTCIVCRTKGDKDKFLRVVRLSDGTYTLDPTGKMSGRGAYICNNDNCVQKCLKTKALNRAYKAQVSDETYVSLTNKLSGKN